MMFRLLIIIIGVNVSFAQTSEYSRIESLLAINKYDEAKVLVLSLQETDKFKYEPQVYFYEGLITYRLEKYKESLVAFNTVIELDSQFAEAYVYRGDLFLKAAYYERCHDDFILALKYGLNNKLLHCGLSEYFIEISDYEKSYEHIGKCYQFDTTDLFYGVNYAELSNYFKDDVVALKVINSLKGLPEAKNDASFLEIAAVINANSEYYFDALNNYQMLKKLRKLENDEHYNISRIYQNLNKLDSSLLAINNIRKKIKGSEGYYLQKAEVLFELKRFEESEKILNKLLKLGYDDYSLYYYLGKLSLIEGDLEEAMEFANKTLKFGESAYTYTLKGEAYLKMGEKEKALDEFNKALEKGTGEDEEIKELIEQCR